MIYADLDKKDLPLSCTTLFRTPANDPRKPAVRAKTNHIGELTRYVGQQLKQHKDSWDDTTIHVKIIVTFKQPKLVSPPRRETD